jgi:hypothetical protein
MGNRHKDLVVESHGACRREEELGRDCPGGSCCSGRTSLWLESLLTNRNDLVKSDIGITRDFPHLSLRNKL